MIKAILVFNNHGKPRVNKFYQYYVSHILSLRFCQVIQTHECFRMKPNSNRSSRRLFSWCQNEMTTFATFWRVGGEFLRSWNIPSCWKQLVPIILVFSLIGGSDYKLIYRHYATLYFVFCVDSSESELGILDLIQVFVETLDKCFESVCELDLIFHMDKVKLGTYNYCKYILWA